MNIQSIDINDSIKNIRKMLKKEKRISTALKASIELLIFVVTTLVNRVNLNSSK